MDFQQVSGLVEELPGGPYSVLVAAVAGLVGVFLLLCCTIRRASDGDSKKEGVEKRSRPVSVSSESEGEENGEGRKRQQPRSKGSKSKQQSSKKIVLPPHPLLAAEFKGHTGAVLSLDFDTTGKYLASCSDGKGMVVL